MTGVEISTMFPFLRLKTKRTTLKKVPDTFNSPELENRVGQEPALQDFQKRDLTPLIPHRRKQKKRRIFPYYIKPGERPSQSWVDISSKERHQNRRKGYAKS